MSTESAHGVQPLVDTRWLALPVSARGLVDELQKYADEVGRVALRLGERVDAHAIGSEIARLLCAHRGEVARIRRDTQLILDDEAIAVDGSSIRICRIARAHATVQTLEQPRAMTDAERSQLRRDREKASRGQSPESSRNVTNVTTERDDFRDDRHGASVTRPLSFKKDLDLKSVKERENVTAIVTERDGISEKIDGTRRARACELGLPGEQIDVVWRGFFVRHGKGKKTARQLDALWAEWVCRRLVWDSQKRGVPKKAARGPDLQAPWIVEATGET